MQIASSSCNYTSPRRLGSSWRASYFISAAARSVENGLETPRERASGGCKSTRVSSPSHFLSSFRSALFSCSDASRRSDNFLSRVFSQTFELRTSAKPVWAQRSHRWFESGATPRTSSCFFHFCLEYKTLSTAAFISVAFCSGGCAPFPAEFRLGDEGG